MTKSQGLITIRFFIVAILTVTISWLGAWIFSVSYPFWIATALVWILIPFIRFLRQKIKLPTAISVLTVLIVGLGIIVGIFVGITVLIIFGIRKVSGQLQNWIETVSTNLQDAFNQSVLPVWHKITGFMDSLTIDQQGTLQEGITQLGTRLAQMLGDFGQKAVDALTHLVLAVPSLLLTFLFVFLAFYFIGKDWDKIGDQVRSSIPERFYRGLIRFKNIFRFRVLGFIKAQLVIMFIAATVVLIGLLILRIEQAFTVAFFVGIAEIIPYLGSGTIIIPWSIYSFIIGDIRLGIGLAVVYVVAAVVRQAVEPKILSSSMNLNTLAVLISLFVGLQIFGLIGVFLGPFILVILVIMKDIGFLHSVKEFILHGWKEEKIDNR